MPSSPLDEFLGSIDPIDAATLFAGLRASVPLGMMVRSGELNVGEDEALARKWAGVPRAQPAPREMTPQDRIAEFERQFPNEYMRRILIDEMLKQRRAQAAQPQPKPLLGPRRVYPEPVATQEMAPIRRAGGGAVLTDNVIPDMTDGGRIIQNPSPFAGGGGVFKKSLDQMEAELIKKGMKATASPDISRRAFFGLSPKTDFPLANIPTKELEKLKNAPSVEERMTRITPSPDAPKIEETVKKVAETPVSRRTVLKSATGQVLRDMMPDVGMQDIAQSVVQSAAPALPQTAQGLMTLALKQGMSVDEAVDFVRVMATRGGKQEPYDLPSLAQHMATPHTFEADEGYLPSSEVLRQMLRYDAEGSPLKLRAPLREIKSIDPKRYEEMMRTARDISEYGFD